MTAEPAVEPSRHGRHSHQGSDTATVVDDATGPRVQLDRIGIVFARPGDSDLVICHDLSVDVWPGRMHVVAGRSGSGKTSVLAVAAGLTTPASGTVRWDGKPIADRNDDEVTTRRRRLIGVLTQGAELVDGLTALENVLVPAIPDGRARELRGRAQELLSDLGVADRARHRPRALSGGERQRVALARALLLEPAVLIADEPTASLDRHWADAVITTLTDLARGGTALLIASHDVHMIDAADSTTDIEG